MYQLSISKDRPAVAPGKTAWVKLAVVGGSLFLSVLAVAAYDPMVVDRLERSRDALLDQKTALEQSDRNLGDTIDELSRKRDRVQTYLRDTDKALLEVDLALRGTK
jgi:hypothetical protein